MSLREHKVRHGLVAGLLAGFVLAVLFFFYDLGRGEPFHTPAFVWGTLFQHGEVTPTVPVIAAFTVVHFMVWAGLGVVAAFLMIWARLPRNLITGAAYGLFACSVVFYVGLLRAPPDLILAAPSWPAVFFGNALAGVVMFTHLHWVSTQPGITGMMNFLETHPTTRRGMAVGVIGAVTVAAWFLIIDFMLREPLYTPAALGTLLFHGGGGPDQVVIEAGRVFGYTLVHFAFFLLFGVMLSGMTDQVEKFPPLIFGLGILFVMFEVFFIAMVAVLGSWILENLAWWSILIGNLLAASTMGFYMWRTHPRLREQLTNEALWAES